MPAKEKALPSVFSYFGITNPEFDLQFQKELSSVFLNFSLLMCFLKSDFLYVGMSFLHISHKSTNYCSFSIELTSLWVFARWPGVFPRLKDWWQEMSLVSLFLVIPKQVSIKKMYISIDTQKTKTHRGIALMIQMIGHMMMSVNSFVESQCRD